VITKSFISTTSTLGVSVNNVATLRLPPSVTTPNNVVLKIPAVNVNIGAKLDLTNNKLIVGGVSPTGTLSGGTYTGVTGLLQRGYNGGGWTGSGIVTNPNQCDQQQRLHVAGGRQRVKRSRHRRGADRHVGRADRDRQQRAGHVHLRRRCEISTASWTFWITGRSTARSTPISCHRATSTATLITTVSWTFLDYGIIDGTSQHPGGSVFDGQRCWIAASRCRAGAGNLNLGLFSQGVLAHTRRHRRTGG